MIIFEFKLLTTTCYYILCIIICNVHIVIFMGFYFWTFFITDKIPDDEHFKNGSKDRQNWEADDIDNSNRNDTGMFPYTNGHVKFDTPKVPVIFVLGKNKVTIALWHLVLWLKVFIHRWTWKWQGHTLWQLDDRKARYCSH